MVPEDVQTNRAEADDRWRARDHLQEERWALDAAADNIRGGPRWLFDCALIAGPGTPDPVLALSLRSIHKAKSRGRALPSNEGRARLACQSLAPLKKTQLSISGSEPVMLGRGNLTKPFAYHAIHSASKKVRLKDPPTGLGQTDRRPPPRPRPTHQTDPTKHGVQGDASAACGSLDLVFPYSYRSQSCKLIRSCLSPLPLLP